MLPTKKQQISVDELPYENWVLGSGLRVMFYHERSLPQNSGDVHLVVTVGTLHEQVHECGLSHYLEHLLVRATLEDDANLFNNLSELGKVHVTSQDNTTYGFHVYNKEQMLIAFKMLALIATKTKLEDKYLALERDIISIENFKDIEDEDDHMRECVIENSVSTQLNIAEWTSTDEVFQHTISSITLDNVTNFYKKWYKLGNMALLCVGNFEFEEIMDMAQFLFHGQVEQDTSLAATQMNIRDKPIMQDIKSDYILPGAFAIFKRPRPTTTHLNDLKLYWDAETTLDAFNQIRDSNMSGNDNERVIGIIVRNTPQLLYIFQTEYNNELPKVPVNVLDFLLEEVSCAREFPLPPNHIQIARENIVKKLESETKVFQNDVHFRCSQLINKLKNNFLYEDAVFDATRELIVAREWRDSDTSSRSFSFLEGCTLSIITTNLYLKKKMLKQAVRRSTEKPLQQPMPIEEKTAVEFSNFYPDSSFDNRDFAKRREYGTGFVEYGVCNGLKVVYHHSPETSIGSLNGFGYGGHSQSNVEDYFSHLYATTVAHCLCTSPLNFNLKNFSDVEATADIDLYTRSFELSFRSVDELEIAMQKVFLLFVVNRVPSEEKLKNASAKIQMAIDNGKRLGYNEAIQIARGFKGTHKVSAGQEAKEIDIHKACDYFNECFKDPSQFTIIIVGNWEVDMVESLIKKYLGSIPQQNCSLSFPKKLRSVKKVSMKFPKGEHRHHLQSLTDSKLAECYISVPLSLEIRNMDRDMMLIESLRVMMEERLVYQLRYKMGKVYSVNSEIQYDGGLDCNNESAIMIFNFEALDNPSVSELVDESVNALEAFRLNGPNKLELTRIKGNEDLSKKLIRAYKSIRGDDNIASTLEVQADQELRILGMEIDSWRTELLRILRYEFTTRHVSVIISQKRPSRYIKLKSGM